MKFDEERERESNGGELQLSCVSRPIDKSSKVETAIETIKIRGKLTEIQNGRHTKRGGATKKVGQKRGIKHRKPKW